MALTLQYQGRTADYTKDVVIKTYTYVTNNVADIDSYIDQNKQYLDVYVEDPEGHNMKLTGLNKQQGDGPFWNLEVEYTWEKSSGSSSQAIEDPEDTAFGEKSANLRSVLINVPLSQVPGYLFNWDHYLIGRKLGNGGDPAIPEWWATDTNGIQGSFHLDTYRWISDYSEIPQPTILQSSSNTEEGDSEEAVNQTIHWVVLKAPVKPGVTGVDRVHYSITESSKWATRAGAGNEVKGKLNKIGVPDYDFGLTDDYDVKDWKCDDANVQWAGEYWLATLTWTSSIGGWDEDLYEKI